MLLIDFDETAFTSQELLGFACKLVHVQHVQLHRRDKQKKGSEMGDV